MKQESWTVTESAVRPNGKPGECFYCHEPVGGQHASACPIRKRSVVVELTYQVVMPVPEHWGDHDINYHLNDGASCANNILQHLERVADDEQKCLCNLFEGAYVREATKEDEEASAFHWESIES